MAASLVWDVAAVTASLVWKSVVAASLMWDAAVVMATSLDAAVVAASLVWEAVVVGLKVEPSAFQMMIVTS